jgi:hypothetical protein
VARLNCFCSQLPKIYIYGFGDATFLPILQFHGRGVAHDDLEENNYVGTKTWVIKNRPAHMVELISGTYSSEGKAQATSSQAKGPKGYI